MVAATLTGIAVWHLRTPPSVSRLTVTLPAGQRLAALDQPAIAISPDGKNLVYAAMQDRRVGTSVSPVSQGQTGSPAATGTQQLFLRPLDSQEAKPIAGTEGAMSPFFSPDSQWIGFFAGGKLKKVSVNGGAPVTLANAPIPAGASWSSQGTLMLQGNTVAGQGLQQVSQEGGTPQPLTRLGKGEVIHRWPEVLPGGKAVLFVGSSTFGAFFVGENNVQIAVEPIGAGDRKNLVQGATQPRYAATGHLLWALGGTLMAAPDGKWLAYSSDESGRREVYVQPYPGPAGKWQISTDGGQEPVWNPNGRELSYRSGSKMMAVDVDTKFGFSAGKPKMLFDGPYHSRQFSLLRCLTRRPAVSDAEARRLADLRRSANQRCAELVH